MTKKKLVVIVASALLAIVIGLGALFWLTRLSPEDCTSYESYDNWTGSCYFECDTDAECDAIQQKVDAELDQYFDGSTAKLSQTERTDKQPVTGDGQPVDQYDLSNTGSDTSGVVYTITADQTLSPSPSSRDLSLWQLFGKVAGRDDIKKWLVSFEVFNDANNDTAASVWASQVAPGKWHMNVNAAFTDDRKDLIHTMVHEYGHIVTLNNSQVDGQVTGTCPVIQISEGCTVQGTVISQFYQSFWLDYDNPESQADYDQSRFVSDYATTNLSEDVAESFSHFVLRPRPSGDSIRDQKVQLFYNYPDMVDLRSRIRSALASEL